MLNLPADKETLRLMAAGFSNKLFHIIILPTRFCQCSCTYCYETPVKEKLKTEDLLIRIFKLIRHRQQKTGMFHINWFGGEPSLRLEEIYLFLEKLREAE